MEDKIKISVPKTLADTLLKDAQDFLFIKSNNQINQNSFLNTLITNYYELFSSDDNSFHNQIISFFNESNININNQDEMYQKLIKIISKQNQSIKNEETTTLFFKPTKISNKSISYINNILIKNESISSYYRRLFISYVSRPKNERELIIFKESYNLLLKSINDGIKVCFSLKNKIYFKEASIYGIFATKD